MALVPLGSIAKRLPSETGHSVEDVTDLTWAVLTWWIGSERHQFAVYGPVLREARADQTLAIVVQASPSWFVDVYEKLISFHRENSEPYKPSVIEVAFQTVPKGQLPGPTRRWPVEWPNLRSDGSVKRESGVSNIYMPLSCKPAVLEFERSLGPAPLFLLEGRRYLMRDVRELLPGERSWEKEWPR
jgi:hypothetical protein